ncbi:hypothetical protein AMJ87_03655 [candidate division WOR_3 bacterium SM23_60]|uniref:CNNM transmembrane domain-containing protein n=1 Tax=candidate division WOR_3 bacterium SM23_60 TaxID=1703780 RepID=A0A0S8GK26_UNCW3|nr:MAG: hypothetical protein AMJ87_03655 [candidate division WOR_3 bacterium SM23_60]
MLLLIIPLVLIILGGLFSASETGLVSIENIKVLGAVREKKRWAKRTKHFLAKPERFFSTILVCENFILVIASTLFAKFFIDLIGEQGVFVSTCIITFVSVTIGQFVPKSFALSYPTRTMSLVSNLIYYLELITYPIVSLYAYVSHVLAGLFKSETEGDSIRQLDIVHAMSEYEEKTSRRAALLFNFSRRRVEEVMIPLTAVFMCERGSELTALSQEQKRLYTRIPVFEGKRNNIIGVFNIKDYFYTGTIQLRKPLFVNARDRCMTIFSIMKQKGEHMAIVHGDGHVIGIVTLEDLIEELVGEIRDEL